MQSRLIVKKFGPIEDIDMDLRYVNVFIGPQASGKSAIAKLYTICKSPLSFIERKTQLFEVGGDSNLWIENFRKVLDDYNILSFLTEETFIDFNSELHHFSYNKGKIEYERKCLNKIKQLQKFSEGTLPDTRINTSITDLVNNFFYFLIYLHRDLFKDEINPISKSRERIKDYSFSREELVPIIEHITKLENDLSVKPALYIPAERNLISIIKGASLSLLNNNVPIPKHILNFGAEYEKATFDKQELDLSFLKRDLKYKNENGVDLIYISETKSVKLTESASGIQSLIPLLLPIVAQREKNSINHLSFVIEEPELNLFPEAQYELIKFLEKGRFTSWLEDIADIGTIHTYTTHSPYILSAFNNLLYAGKIRNKFSDDYYRVNGNLNYPSELFDPIKKVLPVHIDSNHFSAYQIYDGRAVSIFSRETSLIESNFIDDSSEKMAEDFELLMQLI